MNAAKFAHDLLKLKGLDDVKVFCGSKNCYIPSTKVVCLKQDIFHDESEFSKVVAAHEVAHAMQHQYLGVFFYFNNVWIIRWLFRLILECDANFMALRLCNFNNKFYRKLLFVATLKSSFPILKKYL